MKRSITLVFALCTLLSSTWGMSSKETRSPGSFTGISVATGVDATIVKGTKEAVTLDVSGVDMDKVITEVKNGTLKVYVKKKWWEMLGSKRIKVTAVITYTEELKRISSSSGADVAADHTIAADKLTLSASSGSELSLGIDVRDLDASASSGAELEVEGKATTAEVDASSGSSFKGKSLTCQDANLDVSSGANIRLVVTDKLIADASSGGSIKYGGTPSYKDIDKSSGGSVRQKSW